ncbi:MAG: hypothetical protein II888_04145 [Clostridia bacterium]|nr:hypothetical protein [Clostridia bacterium]
MYKLLLVSDRQDVLNAFAAIEDWEFLGFKQPHVRYDLEGAKEGLKKHHVDGIAYALSDEAEQELIEFLREEYPVLPIVEAGRTPEEVKTYMSGFLRLLNNLRADFASSGHDEQEMLIRARHHFFRSIMGGRVMSCRQMTREIRLLRSRIDPNLPCIRFRLNRIEGPDDPELNWDEEHLLERELYQSISGDVAGMHILPLIPVNGSIWVLAGAIRGEKQAEDAPAQVRAAVKEGIQHAERYRGIRLNLVEEKDLPCLYALCGDYEP